MMIPGITAPTAPARDDVSLKIEYNRLTLSLPNSSEVQIGSPTVITVAPPKPNKIPNAYAMYVFSPRSMPVSMVKMMKVYA